MKKNMKKITCTLLSVLFIFGMLSACSTNTSVSVTESTTQAVTDETSVDVAISDKVQEMADDTIEAVKSGEDLASDEQLESSFEEEQNLENGVSVEQDDVAYEGTNSKKGLDLIGAYQGLTYFNQGDSRWANLPYTSTGNKSQTMKSSACGPTSAAMVVSSSKGLILPTTMAELSVDNGFRTRDNGTAWAYFPFVADFFDFDFYDETSNFSEALKYMQTDKDKNGISDFFIIMSCNSGLWTTGGHYVVWINQVGTQSAINDPYLYPTKFNTASRRAANVTVSGNTAYLTTTNLQKYSNAKRYFIFSNDQTGKQTVDTTANKKPATTSVSYTRYVATQSQSLNVRSGAGTNYKIVRSLAKGSKVTVIATNGGWSQIGTNEWVSTAYLSATKVTTSASNKAPVTVSTPTFKVGSTYTLTTNVKVRTGAGTNYAQKKTSQLTVDGRKHALNQTYAVLKSGTKFTVQQVKKNGSDIWVKIPSGWICVYYNGSKYTR